MSNDQDPNNSSSINRMLRQSKLDYEGINNTLLKNIEKLDNEKVILLLTIIFSQN